MLVSTWISCLVIKFWSQKCFSQRPKTSLFLQKLCQSLAGLSHTLRNVILLNSSIFWFLSGYVNSTVSTKSIVRSKHINKNFFKSIHRWNLDLIRYSDTINLVPSPNFFILIYYLLLLFVISIIVFIVWQIPYMLTNWCNLQVKFRLKAFGQVRFQQIPYFFFAHQQNQERINARPMREALYTLLSTEWCISEQQEIKQIQIVYSIYRYPLSNAWIMFICEMHSCCPDFECGKFAFGDINLDIDCLKCLWNSREFSGDDKMFAVLLWPR